MSERSSRTELSVHEIEQMIEFAIRAADASMA
jgi:hypothetical protein